MDQNTFIIQKNVSTEQLFSWSSRAEQLFRPAWASPFNQYLLLKLGDGSEYLGLLPNVYCTVKWKQ